MDKVLILLLLLFGHCFAGNYLSVRDTTVQINQSFPLVIELSNTDSVIAFQFDLELPSSILYADSFTIIPLLKNHKVLISLIGCNTIRFLCYSMNNHLIPGTSDPVILFTCKTGNQTGTFEVRLKNGVIGNAKSRDVLDSLQNGIIKIFTPTGIEIPHQGKKNKQL